MERPPILIGGCGRSGTTLLLSVLSAHEKIFAVPYEMWALWPTRSREEFASLVQDMIEEIGTMDIPAECHRWCEKTPKNVHAFGSLLGHFGPDVRLIHMTRDGRDVVTSIHPHDPSEFWVSVDRWIWDVTTGLEYEDHPQVETVRYEDLVLNFSETMKDVYAFLEEDIEERRLEEWHRYSTIHTHSALSDEMRTLFHDSVGRWKNPRYKERVAELTENPEAVALLNRLGCV